MAGYSDWRLPSLPELLSIVDFSKQTPSIDETYFPGTAASHFWSNTPLAGDPTKGWDVSFSFGGFNSTNPWRASSPCAAYAERRASAMRRIGTYPLAGTSVVTALLLLTRTTSADAPAGRFNSTGKNQVYDTMTKLTWARMGSTGKVRWSDASSACASTGPGWRLPTVKELSSLLDFSQTSPPMTDHTFFGDTQPAHYWTASALAVDGGNERWYVLFAIPAYASYLPDTDLAYYRCVR